MSTTKLIKIVTHNADFHTDDVFAVAILLLTLDKKVGYEIIRTRDDSVIQTADYVVDVGGTYDASARRFDHHQIGGAGTRANGIAYASCGLMWKTYGVQITYDEDIAKRIDEKIITPIDASDNGFDTHSPLMEGLQPYVIQQYISSFNPTWKEDETSVYEAFIDMVMFAQKLLQREISVLRDVREGVSYVHSAYQNAEDKRLIVIDEDYPWHEVLSQYPEPFFVVYPNSARDMWRLKTVRDNTSSYKLRKALPETWAGKTGAELQQITGVPDAVFCHNKRFTSAARSKEGALALARIALEN